MDLVIAIIRPDAWNFPLLIHILGAMLMMGALVLSGSALFIAWRDGAAPMVRLGFRSLWIGVIPAWILLRVGAEWIASKEHLENSNVSWIGIGFSTADGGLVLLLIATLLGGLGVSRLTRAGEGSNVLTRIAALLVAILIAAYLVTLWAMTTKPS